MVTGRGPIRIRASPEFGVAESVLAMRIPRAPAARLDTVSSSPRSPLVASSGALVISFLVVLGLGFTLARPSNAAKPPARPTIAVTIDGGPNVTGLPVEISDAAGKVVVRGEFDEHGGYAANSTVTGLTACVRPPAGFAVRNPEATVIGGELPASCLRVADRQPTDFHLVAGTTVLASGADDAGPSAFAGAVVEVHDATGAVVGTSALDANGRAVVSTVAGRPVCLRPPQGWTVLKPVAAHGGLACAVFDGPYATFTVGRGSAQ
jgi:hypothetical protein